MIKEWPLNTEGCNRDRQILSRPIGPDTEVRGIK